MNKWREELKKSKIEQVQGYYTLYNIFVVGINKMLRDEQN